MSGTVERGMMAEDSVFQRRGCEPATTGQVPIFSQALAAGWCNIGMDVVGQSEDCIVETKE